MNLFLKRMASPTALGVFFMLSGAFAFGTAQFLQRIMHLMPCELCYLERKPWIVLFILGIIMLISKKHFFKSLATCGCAVILISLGLGVLHIGVEHAWWPSPFPSCAAQTSLFKGGTAHLLNNLPELPSKPCDFPDYLLGLPLTLWSFIYSGIVFLGTGLLIYINVMKSSLSTEK
ncbi:disulfide bond formation protein B [Acetobacteraceae bacterium]|nr:disulfide bond formation protein B [Acetobacteraceae bacterium]